MVRAKAQWPSTEIISTDRSVGEMAITPLCHGGVRGSIPLQTARRFIMDWKKNEIKILRNFSCPKCGVTVAADNEIQHKTYDAHCPRCEKRFLVKIMVIPLGT